MHNLKVVFWGTSEFAIPSLESLLKNNFNVVAVVTQPDRPKGRGKKSLAPPLKDFASSLGLRILQYEKIRKKTVYDELISLKPNLMITAAYGKILSLKHLLIPEYGVINVHASLLPELRGAAPVAWAILNGHCSTGVTIMKTELGMDSGPIISQKKTSIGKNETAGELESRLSVLGAELLLETIPAYISGEIILTRQSEEDATYAPALFSAMAAINWNQNAKEIARKIRGFNPNPGAYTSTNGQRMKIHHAKVFEDNKSLDEPGTILDVIRDQGLLVQTGQGHLLVEEIQPPSRKRMRADLLLNGRYVKIGDKFD